MKNSFRSSGKLLLSGEYAILDGAMGLAVPTAKGQSLFVTRDKAPGVHWQSRDCDGKTWFSTEITWAELNDDKRPNKDKSVKGKLLLLLREAKKLNPDFLNRPPGCYVETVLEFPRQWGLGSSSTLIHNIALWSGTNAFELQKRTFGGSGYDIACASRTRPIFYQRIGEMPVIEDARFYPPFASSLFFVYMNRKQDSEKAIANFRKKVIPDGKFLDKVTEITRQIAGANNLACFEECILEHENLLSSTLGQPTVKELYFRDYGGCIKSLGAWGGDFILVSGSRADMGYFADKGYTTIVPYGEMVA